MNILLTGFSGTLGSAVAETLLTEGHRLRVLLHGAVVDPMKLDPDIEIVWGSLSQQGIFDRLTKEVDVVVHCAWEGRRALNSSIEKVNLNGTVELMKMADRNNVKTFVHISSISVFGLNRSLWCRLLDENQPLVSEENSMDSYTWVKVLIEKKCEELQATLKMNLMVVRPGILFSDKKAPAKKIVSFMGKKYGLLIGRARNHLPYIHVADVAQLILMLIEKPRKYEVYNCVPTIHLPAREFLENWGRYHNLSIRIVRLPPLLLRMMAWGVRRLKAALGREDGGTSINYQIMTGIRDIRYSVDKAVEQLGWQDTQTNAIAKDIGR
jgi:nucleoside-diphosphate-sugar epimerase